MNNIAIVHILPTAPSHFCRSTTQITQCDATENLERFRFSKPQFSWCHWKASSLTRCSVPSLSLQRELQFNTPNRENPGHPLPKTKPAWLLGKKLYLHKHFLPKMPPFTSVEWTETSGWPQYQVGRVSRACKWWKTRLGSGQSFQAEREGHKEKPCPWGGKKLKMEKPWDESSRINVKG